MAIGAIPTVSECQFVAQLSSRPSAKKREATTLDISFLMSFQEARRNSAEKKESTDPRLSQLCPPYVTPSSSSSLEYHRSDARIVENGFAAGSGMSNSAKVGLVFAIARRRIDVGRDGARGGADDRAGIAVGLHGREEGRIHAAVAAGRDRRSGGAAVDQLDGLHLVTVLLRAYRDRDVVANPVGWATLGGAEPVRGFGIEDVALLAYINLRFETCDLEMVMTLLDHSPERHMRRIAMLGHVERRHPKRIGLQLERPLAAEERFAGERVDFRDLLVGHGVAAGRRAAAMDHQERAAAAVRAIVCIREARIDREILA